jgi:hypothetical protein
LRFEEKKYRAPKQKEVSIERQVGKVSVEDFDALLIPGGSSPDKLQ